ncbi:thiamine phosphate synthase [Salipaludibacillus keqinensis]|uniref:Thiamine-phosphate synthase n=1 Tax=Salipaludibacillus keqinensis TaxID=2045207 RepID=A0A323TDM7_9BACI|nr:thiamine phosphate synthase [Salipaludibacillus keqinensis]PYZ92324.1 thiamine phosphate synthase [Salipaludibacillus keqinensis]
MSKHIDNDTLKQALSVYFISGTTNVNRPLPNVLTEAISGGITLFQFREKGSGCLTNKAKRDMAEKLFQVCKDHQIGFIINDDVELAIAMNADGIHIGQKDAGASITRKMIGENMILGVSVHTIEEAKQAVADGADYLGVGPIFQTNSKQDAEEVCGPERIMDMRKSGINLPIVAIGGITVEKTPEIKRAGADGVSIISAIASAPSPSYAANQFKEIMKD